MCTSEVIVHNVGSTGMGKVCENLPHFPFLPILLSALLLPTRMAVFRAGVIGLNCLGLHVFSWHIIAFYLSVMTFFLLAFRSSSILIILLSMQGFIVST